MGGIVDRKRGLRQKSEIFRISNRYATRIVFGFDQRDRPGRHLSQSTDNLRMAFMPDKQDVPTRFDLPFGLPVDLGDQRAGCVEIVEPAILGVMWNRFGYAMCRKNNMRAFRHLVQFLDKNCALCL